MIVDRLEGIRRTAMVDARISIALDWISANSKVDIPPGKYEADKGVYALVQSYGTKDRSEIPYESHRKYIDLHYMVNGREHIDVCPIDKLVAEQPYDAVKDAAFYSDGPGHCLIMEAGIAALLYPEDAHRPCVAVGSTGQVRKFVLKIPID